MKKNENIFKLASVSWLMLLFQFLIPTKADAHNALWSGPNEPDRDTIPALHQQAYDVLKEQWDRIQWRKESNLQDGTKESLITLAETAEFRLSNWDRYIVNKFIYADWKEKIEVLFRKKDWNYNPLSDSWASEEEINELIKNAINFSYNQQLSIEETRKKNPNLKGNIFTINTKVATDQ